ncbi:hypothetical protein [Tenuifilum osseticum]|uniref:hypothetical protein n=1 Tax=Tenuifilum osseticum TaxID=3374723 RepID=UPI0034E3C396
MGTPRVELSRDTIRHACGVTHVVSLTRPTATFYPRPIYGSGFYAVSFYYSYWLRNRICKIKVKGDASTGLSMTIVFSNNEQPYTINFICHPERSRGIS